MIDAVAVAAVVAVVVGGGGVVSWMKVSKQN